VLLAAIAAAVVWVSDVRFKDYASAWDCGVPMGAAWHGRQIPKLPADYGNLSNGPVGVVGVPVGTGSLTKTVCAGEARRRVAIAFVVTILASAGLVAIARRWRASPQPHPQN
jgi:hypothetical protein